MDVHTSQEIQPDQRPSISEIISVPSEPESMDGHSTNEIQLENTPPISQIISVPSERESMHGNASKEIQLENRPPILEIISATSEPESMDGNPIQISHDFNEDDRLGINQLELRLLSNIKKDISCSIGLTNDTIGSLLPKRAIFSRHYPTDMKYLGKESDRAVDVARGAMGSLLDKLAKLVIECNRFEKSMKRDIESFSVELVKIHLDLLELEKLDDAKLWANEVRGMSYKIEDMVDGLLVHVDPESNMSTFKVLPNGNNHIGDVIKDIKKNIQLVADMGEKYKCAVKNVVTNATAEATNDLHILAINKDKKELIGIKMPRDELIRLFEEDGDVPKQNLKVCSIVGMGGLGKTTLAKAVYDKLKGQYSPRAFVTMGQNVDVKIVLKNVLIECRNDASNLEHMDVQQLINQLQELLKYKRYFIVIDDIWDSEAWDAINSSFPRNNRGSRVITTTRIDHIAHACCYAETKYMHVMKPLSDEDSGLLFLTAIYGPEKTWPDAMKEIPLDAMRGITTDIVKGCAGMPLAINGIASFLASDQPTSAWDNARKNWGSMIKGNKYLESTKQIMDLNYIHLPDQLKTCLLHAGMYLENRDIEKDDLLRQWVAEGFVHVSTNGELDAEDVAEQYFKELLDMLMIVRGEVDDRTSEVLSCRVHPIILDFIRLKSTKENFFHVIDGSKDEKGKIHQVSVHYNDKEDERILETIKEGSLSHVRSVYLYRSLLVPYFLEFKYVRVLHIEHHCNMGTLDLTGISRLFLLRYLKVTSVGESGYELTLPNQIRELQHLETIDLHNASLKKYPSDIVSLPWLSHLILTGNEAGVLLPDGIERLKSSLRTLVGVSLYGSSVEKIFGISKMTNLRKLHICSTGIWQGKEEAIMRMDALHSSISMLSSNLRILILEGPLTIQMDVPGWTRRTLFPGGSPIRELDMGSCEYARCPEWIGQLHQLKTFTIQVREVADAMNIVAGLPSLTFFNLRILNHNELKEERVVIPGGGAFKELKHLLFYCPMASLTFESGAMPKLQNLNIVFRYHMARRFLPVGVKHLPAGTLTRIWLCVLPYIPSQAEGAPVMARHRTSVRRMLKGAFKPHHPTARIFFTFDKEDCVL